MGVAHKSHVVAPNGIMYVKETVRKGLLGRMLTELLDTRVMVKQAMKGVKDDKVWTTLVSVRRNHLNSHRLCVEFSMLGSSDSSTLPTLRMAIQAPRSRVVCLRLR